MIWQNVYSYIAIKFNENNSKAQPWTHCHISGIYYARGCELFHVFGIVVIIRRHDLSARHNRKSEQFDKCEAVWEKSGFNAN